MKHLRRSSRPTLFRFPSRSPKTGSIIVLLALGLFGNSWHSSAQGFSIGWYKIAGGGGTSSNSQFSITGTIGQAEAGGALTGGAFSVSGGFWTVSTIVSPGAPLLRIYLTSTNAAVIAWPSPSTGYSLQVTTNLAAPVWIAPSETQIDDGTQKSIIVSPRTGNRFYRLTNP
jgi:hypothetical protein